MTKIEKGIVTIVHRFFLVDQSGLSWARIVVTLALLFMVLGYVGTSDVESLVIE